MTRHGWGLGLGLGLGLVLLASACAGPGASSSSSSSSAGGRTRIDRDAPGGPVAVPISCEGIGTSTLDGVCIWFPKSSGSFTVAKAKAGIDVPYYVIVERDVSGVISRSQDAGDCVNAGESGLHVFEQLTGNDQNYCLCDEGLCMPEPEQRRTLRAGFTRGGFWWEGVNWYGASDTGNPYGPPFPPGVYTLELSAVGTVDGRAYEVRSEYELTLRR